ncbi:MAG: molybdopterin-guanine dinucleotide biosynthesis protein B [Halorhodospira halophila]|uniref:molybdopterin-guanine dinucleotide biosynthesis protein B n=1 Tax=Halorhodospira TaxID=85108 RepID=UPI00191133FE|nr:MULTISPECIES: molybdopterin-guanine dinucleotide biosynthesis protein B [Halorhodospira]MBK5936881.1 molybdopterin-guanine dinucleotide biosynthesis protein B [Halorhodospira halophila]MBK5942326.1 molybdopterin-guanine dinucleotide biosynthesis protein B [Halorhodospira halophila]MCC3750333.1 molybdopterin-guanine dinucleotide biosynthesis protein B [Halorhodospira halophila]MCG5528108.1 molybdopterin-guanine dinucleotide biosynthesis protein B [Halorhodospira halophila]MCG5531877.1 molybd
MPPGCGHCPPPPEDALQQAARLPALRPVIAVTGYSGAGKTTLLTGLVARMRRGGWSPAVVKHAHHGFDMDRPGKDSYRAREAGAEQVLVVSARRWALLTETPTAERDEDLLVRRLQAIDPERADVIIAEGFRHSGAGQLLVHSQRTGTDRPDFRAPGILGVATDEPQAVPSGLPCLDLDDQAAIAAFVEQCIHGIIARTDGNPAPHY